MTVRLCEKRIPYKTLSKYYRYVTSLFIIGESGISVKRPVKSRKSKKCMEKPGTGRHSLVPVPASPGDIRFHILFQLRDTGKPSLRPAEGIQAHLHIFPVNLAVKVIQICFHAHLSGIAHRRAASDIRDPGEADARKGQSGIIDAACPFPAGGLP